MLSGGVAVRQAHGSTTGYWLGSLRDARTASIFNGEVPCFQKVSLLGGLPLDRLESCFGQECVNALITAS